MIYSNVNFITLIYTFIHLASHRLCMRQHFNYDNNFLKYFLIINFFWNLFSGVVASYPVCRDTEIGGDPPYSPGTQPILFSCRIDYVGNLPPKIVWTDRDGNIQTGSQDTTTPTYVVSNFTPTAQLPYHGPYNATTYFDAPTFNPPPALLNPDMNAPSYLYVYQSSLYEVEGGVTPAP